MRSHHVTISLHGMKLIQNLSFTLMNSVFNYSFYIASYSGKASGQRVEGTGSNIT